MNNVERLNIAEDNLCPVCDSIPLPIPYYRTYDWLVLRCSHCTYAWVLDLAELPEKVSFDWGEDIVQESKKRIHMYQDRLKRIEKYAPNPRIWLDIGCGGGGMLKCVADAGFIVEGIEPSPAADYIPKYLGISSVHKKILSQSLVDLCFCEYGVISYFHVLEHVHDPRTELIAVRKIIADRGLLVIEVPFFDSLPWKLLRSRHRHLYNAHRSYFNKKSISTLLQRTGFQVLKSESVPYYMSIDWLLMRLTMRLGKSIDILRNFVSRNILDRSIQITTGEYLMVIAKKI